MSSPSDEASSHQSSHQVSAVEMSEEHRQKVTFFVGGTEASLSPTSPTHDPATSLTAFMKDNVFEDSLTSSEVQVITQSSSRSMYSYTMQSETKQTNVTGPVTTPAVVPSQGRPDKQDTSNIHEVIGVKDKPLGENDKNLESVNSSQSEDPKAVGSISSSESQKVESSAGLEQEKAASPSNIMQTFEEREKLFRDLFLSQSIIELSEEAEKSLVPYNISRQASLMETSAEGSSGNVPRQIVGLDHLDNLVKLMEQLAWLKEENQNLKRKVLYLEDTKSLLLVRAQMLETRVHQSMEALEHSHHQGPTGFFSHQQSRAKSIISKQSSKIMQYLSTGSTSSQSQQHSPQKVPLEKCPSDNTDILNRQAKSVQQGSKEQVSPTNSPTSPTLPGPLTASAAQMMYNRSQSVGSIEMVDLDLTTTVMELDTVKPPGHRSSPSKSLMFKRSDFKASRKLQEKWERVKKVFGSKPEAEFEGSVTAEEILKVNSRSPRLQKNRPPSLTHMASLDVNTETMDRLKPEDRVLSRSNPQLNEQPPHTPSSTHSEPPTVKSSHTSEEEDVTAFKFDTKPDAPAPSTPKASVPEQVPLKSRTSSTSSSASNGSSEVEEAFKYAPSKKELDASLEDSNYLSVSRLLKRRRSSPTLSTQDQELCEQDAGSKSPRVGRSASFKVTRNRSPQQEQLTLSESVSVPTTPVSSDTDQRKPSPFRAASTDAHKKAKQAWGRVKNIIHNKKDSLKLRKSKSAEDKDSDMEQFSPHQGTSFSDELKSAAESTNTSVTTASSVVTSPPIETTTTTATSPTTPAAASERSSSPTLLRRLTQKARGASPRQLSPDNRRGLAKPSSPDLATSPQKRESIAQAMVTGSPADVMALMGVSEEYQRKMQDWEEKKKKGLTKANSFADGESLHDQQTPHKQPSQAKKSVDDVKYSEEFIKKMEEWEQKKGLAVSPLLPQGPSMENVYPTSVTPRDQSPTALPAPVEANTSEISQLSESFSKRVQEWERVKTKRSRETAASTSPDGRSRKQKRATVHITGRSKSLERSRERSRSQSKFDRELMMKIEKKEQKIKREKLKLDKMKQKLELGLESSSGSDGKSEHVLSQDFMRRLREWEEMKGLSPSHLEVASLESPHHLRSHSQKENSERRSISRDRLHSDSAIQPLSQRPAAEVAGSPGSSFNSSSFPGSGIPKPAETTSTESRHAKRMPQQDLEEVINDKDEEIATLQDDIAQMTERINLINKEHSQEIATYRRELWASSKVGRFTIESDLMSASLRELDLQINYLQDYSQRLAKEKRQLHMRVQEETRNRREIEAHLLEDLKKLQNAVLGKGLEGSSGSGLPNDVMSHLYSYLAQSQEQLSELRENLTERGRLLEEMERHLLVQEVTNKLLIADLHRRELEVRYLREARKKAVIRRWKTYGGMDFVERKKPQDMRPALKRNNSSVLRQSIKRQSSCEQLCRHIRQMQQTNAVADEVFSMPADWLQQLQAQIEQCKKSSLPELPYKVTALHTTTAMVQTVMTLCNCPYLPQPPPSPPPAKLSVTTGTNTVETVTLETKEVQTSLENLAKAIPESSPTAGHGQVKVRKELFPEAASKERQYSLPTDSIPRDQIDRLIQQYRKQDVGVHTLSAKQDQLQEKSPSLGRRPKSGSLYSEWLKREYKPPKIEHRKLSTGAENKDKEQDALFDSKIAGPETSPKVSSAGSEGTIAVGPIKVEGLEVNDKGAIVEGVQAAVESEVDAKPPQMPRSPIIRSKYPRRNKTTEVRMQNLYATESQAVWKATPLRRAFRHRKSSTEKSPDGSLEAVCSSEDIRERTKSDSSIMHSPVTTEATGSLTKQYLSVDHQDDKNKGVRDIVSRYERIQLHSAPQTTSSLQSSPSLGRALQRRSPVPMAVSPVRRLKTAQELLQDLEKSKCVKNEQSSLRDQPPSCSSDKENDKGTPKSKVLQMIERFSAEGNEEESEQRTVRSRSGSMELSHRQTPSSHDSPKPPLKDLTNEGIAKRPSALSGLSASDNAAGSPTASRLFGHRRSPKAASRAMSLSAAEACAVMRERSSTNPGSVMPDTQATTAPTTPTSLDASPLNMRSGKGLSLHGKQGSTLSNGAEESASSPWLLQEKKSPKQHKKRRVTPMIKPSSPARSSKSKGAISALCMQAMSISVETSASGSHERLAPPGSPSGKEKKEKSKNKFMDSYRKLFKVSKC